MKILKIIEIIIIRALGFPFFACIALIGVIHLYVKCLINFIRFGGESVAYTQKMQRKTIADVFHQLIDKKEIK